MKIVKTHSRTWGGNGFGHSAAVYGVQNAPHIRITRESGFKGIPGLWIATLASGQRLVADSRAELETMLVERV